MEKYLLAGLGNIGLEYAGTRHNIGFDVADALIRKHNGLVHSGRLADISEIKIKGRHVTVIKPTTYMNLSGRAVKYWMEKERIPLNNLLIIMDDLAIPLEKLRLRSGGSDGGHNGLKSIQECLGTSDYARLRFGIGSNYQKGHQVDFVLGKWQPNEMDIVEKKISKSLEIIEIFILGGVENAMNEANKLSF